MTNMETAIARIEEARKSKASKLDLSGLKLRGVPTQILHLSRDLQELDLSLNYIGEKEVALLSKLRHLTILNLSDNSLNENGAAYISKLSKLTTLDISTNSIGEQGAEHISKLRKLTTLNLWGNSIGDTGATHISMLKNLATLDLSGNYIGDQGAEYLSKLSKLTTLDLFSNSIGDTGAAHISKLRNLKSLDLSGNSIGNQGAEHISKLVNLSKLDLKSNEITSIPSELLDNAKGFFAYWQATKKKPNTVVKMVLIGNGRAGKTSLSQYLTDRKYPHQKGQTHGILSWQWKIKGNPPIKVNILDFGGQDYYHATHNLFIDGDRDEAGDAMYLLLWDTDSIEANQNDNQNHPIPYWLGNVRNHSIKAPIWSVQNKMDLTRAEWLNSQWVKDYMVTNQYHISMEVLVNKNIKDSKYLTAEYERFERQLSEFLRVKAMEKVVPHSWVSIRDKHLPFWRIEWDGVIPIDQFKRKCLAELSNVPKANRESELAFDGLLPYLQGAGEIIMFDDIPILKDKIFLDPIKLINAIYGTLLSPDVLKNQGGEFSLPRDGSMWHAKLQDYLHLLLSKGLVFEKPNEPGVYVAPQYLAEDPHTSHFTSLVPVSFVLKFNGYFPRSRITQFITRYAAPSEHPLYWKFGAFFKKDGVHAMVRIELSEYAIVNVHVGNEKGRYQVMKELFRFFLGMENTSTYPEGPLIESTHKSVDIDHESDDRRKNYTHLFKMVDLSTNGKDFAPINDWQRVIDTKGSHVEFDGKRLKPDAVVHQLLGDELSATPKRIFLSYSHKDEPYKEELDAHFSALKRSGKVETWNDRKIEAGELWDSKILDTLGESDIFIALLSPDFIASDYIWINEIPLAQEKGCAIVPVFLRACDFAETPFAEKQGFPKDEDSPDAVSKQKHTHWIVGNRDRTRDLCYLEVVEGIKRIIDK